MTGDTLKLGVRRQCSDITVLQCPGPKDTRSPGGVSGALGVLGHIVDGHRDRARERHSCHPIEASATV